jgi:AraC family transcriptional regulator
VNAPVESQRGVRAGAFRLRDTRYAASSRQARHAHDELQITVVLRGELHEDAAGALHRGHGGDVVVKPAGTMHSDAFDRTRTVCIDADPSAVDLPISGYRWHRADPVSAAGVRLALQFLRGEDVGDALCDLAAALTPRGSNHRIARQAAESLEASFDTPVNVATLAADLGVHPVYLARAFRARWGCSPRDYVQRLRVRAAAAKLASDGEPIATIALDAGFADQSHMTRVFTRCFGVAPAAYRRLARG